MHTWQIVDEWDDVWTYENHSAEAAWSRHFRTVGTRPKTIKTVCCDEH